jgi:hypothetical protein
MARQPTARRSRRSPESLPNVARHLAQGARRARERALTESDQDVSTSDRRTMPQSQRRITIAQDTMLLALRPLPPVTPTSLSPRHKLKPFDVECQHCGARHWIEERTSTSTVASPEFSMCCAKGTIELLPLPRPPEPLYSYYHGRSPGTYTLPIASASSG